jgi:eukaryotic-like serine/threonine-protein kinase
VAAQQSFLDIHSEPAFMHSEPVPTSALWSMTPRPAHAIDTTSRVISFVLGFALASLIAWLGSISSNDIAATQVNAPVAPASIRVVPTATEEKRATTLPAPGVPTVQPQTAPPATSHRGALALSSSPEGAEVILNGKVVGETPVVLSDLPVGARTIVVRQDGYAPWSASIGVVANQRTNVRATLVPAQ